jgi:hypothetical protein
MQAKKSWHIIIENAFQIKRFIYLPETKKQKLTIKLKNYAQESSERTNGSILYQHGGKIWLLHHDGHPGALFAGQVRAVGEGCG